MKTEQTKNWQGVDRRYFLLGATAVGGAAILGNHAIAIQAAGPAATDPFSLPKLEYAYDALEPHIDARTMEIHYTRHHAAYVKNLNAAVAGTEWAKHTAEDLVTMWQKLPEAMQKGVRNAGGGHVNHTLFWSTLSKTGGSPQGELMQAIQKSFGSLDACWEKLSQSAMGVFGSGWGWLSWNAQHGLIVESTPNQDSPLSHGNTPLFGIDVWEHAYYLKYQNMRADYVAAIRNVVAWERVAERLRAAKKTQ
jgi:Fe-Mn family superoxide dismutase